MQPTSPKNQGAPSTGPGLPHPRSPSAPSTEEGTGAYVPGEDAETLQGGQASGPVAVAVPGYEIESVLGRGGMGVVYKARHVALNRLVALKFVVAGGHAGPRELARFRLEAVAVARLQHPNIVQIHEVSEADGHPYLALEFVEGGNLADRITDGPMPPAEAAKLVEVLARAMQLAHSRNVIHRDLKPANVLLAADGTPKITDFGLARQLDADSGETQVGAVMGTPSYMAPEQASGHGHEAGPAADVYALGAILYTCLTGCPPFKGKSTPETLEQVRTQAPEPPSRLQPGLPMDLETICLKCLRKEPEHRYASAAELADELGRFQQGEPILARPVGSMERAWRWCRRNPALALLSGGLVAALIVGLVASISFALVAQKEAAAAKEASGRAAERERDAINAQELANQNAAKARANERLAFDRAYNSDLRMLQQAWEKNQVDYARELLERQRPERTDGVERRGFEWHYWDRQSRLRLLNFAEQPGGVGCVAFSPDGKFVASGGGGDYAKRAWALRIYDSRAAKVIHELSGPGRRVMGLAFSPDSKRLVSTDLENAHVWDVKTGKELFKLVGHTTYLTAVAWSRDGKHIAAGGGDFTVRLWDATTGKPRLVLRDAGLGPPACVAFSPDSRRVAAGGPGDLALRVWDVTTGKKLLTLSPNKPARPDDGILPQLQCVAFSPDGKWLAAYHDGWMIIWDAVRGTKSRTLDVKTRALGGVAFSPDSKLLITACGGDGLKAWDVDTGQHLFSFKGGHVSGVAFSPNGNRLASGLTIWDATAAKRSFISCPQGPCTALGLASDGKRLFAGMRVGLARAYDLSTHKELSKFGSLPLNTQGLAIHPRGHQAVLPGVVPGVGPTLEVWGPIGGKLLHRERLSILLGIRVAAYSPDGAHFATVGSNGPVRIWSSTDFKEVRRLQSDGDAFGLAWSKDNYLALRNSKGVTVWEASTGRVVAELTDQTNGVGPVAFSPDGKQIATANYGGVVTLWRPKSDQPPRRLTGHTSWVTGLAFSPDGRRLASCGADKCVKLWDPSAGEELLTLVGEQFLCVAFSPDGRKLFAGTEGGIRIWEGPK